MPASQEQKVDFLLKKIGYSASKTGIAEDESAIGINTNTAKAPFEEGIPSPLIIPSTNILSDSSFIPTTPPGSDTAYVKVYSTTSALRMTRDSTVGTATRTYIAYTTYNDTSSARLTNWIDTQFGSSYILKVFKDDPTVPANELQQAGAGGGTDGWFFDYSSGVLNFNGNALPSGISATNIYIVGYRYIGATGVQPPAGIGTFHDLVISNNLSVGGISTLSKEVGIGSALNVVGVSTFSDDVTFVGDNYNLLWDKSDSSLEFGDNTFAVFGSQGDLKIRHNTTITPNASQITNASSSQLEIIADNLELRSGTSDKSYLTATLGAGTTLFYDDVIRFETIGIGASVYGQLNTTTLNVSGVSTFAGTIDANGIIEATAGQNKIPSLYQNFSDLPNAGTYHGMFAHVHALGRGYFAHGGAWYELVNKESNGVVGTGTEKYNLGFTDTVNLKVTGITTLGSIGISTGIISGPSVTYIDPATVGDNTGTVVIKGDLQIDGTQTTVNSSIMTVSDKNIEMAVGAANDAAADGGGITVKSGDGDKTWRWLNGTDSWTSSEHIRIPDGKVFGFASDTNTYIGRPAADVIAFTTNAEERLRINNVGDVGIGSDSTGGARLRVYQDGTDTLLQQWRGSLGSTAGERPLNLYSPATDSFSDYFRFQTGNAIKFQIDSIDALCIEDGGNIGIGTDDPTQKLEVYDGKILVRNKTDDAAKIILRDDSGSYNHYQIRNEDGTFKIRNSGASPQYDAISVLSTGNIGINSTIPTARLDVNGDTKLQGNVNVAGITTFSDDIDFHGATGITSIRYDKSANELRFKDNVRLKFGDGQDLHIYHSGGGSIIREQGVGDLTLTAQDIILQNVTNGQTMGQFVAGGTVKLYHNGQQKFMTTGTGIEVPDLSVTGVSTFTGNIDANGNLDVDGQTDLDDLNVSGVSTFTGNIHANGNIVGDNQTAITGILRVSGSGSNSMAVQNVKYVGRSANRYESSFLDLNDQNVPAFGGGGNFTTLASLSGLNLVYDTNNNDNNGLVIGSGSTNTSLMTTHMVVSHVGNVGIGSTIPAAKLDVNGDLDVDGRSELDNVNIAETLNVVGVSTFQDDVTFTTQNGNNVVLDKSTNGLDFGDNVSLRFGASDDLVLYHDQSVSRILDTYGHLLLNSNLIELKSNTGNKSYFSAINGSHTKLFYNGNEKFATSGVGVTVTGLTETDTLNTGNATFTGTVSAGSTTGTDGYYLQSTGVGVTWAQFPTMRTNQVFTATADQTTFSFNYNIGFLDVFVNGVKLPTSEFTASNGSSVILDDGCFVNDTVELISYNTVPSAGSGAQTLNQLDNVTITGIPVIGETLQHNGSAFVNDYTPSATTTSTSQTAILSLATATYRSVEYTVQITEGTKYHVTKILAIHDGTNVSFNEYGTLFTTSSLATFALDVNSGNMRLLATPASSASTVFKIKFNGIKV